MARLTRGTRPRDWLAGRIEVAEILAAQADTATPDRLAKGPHLGLTTGPLADRRTTRQPAPPRRIRPRDLEATGTGTALYGARIVVPWPYQDMSLVGARDAGTLGEVVSYTVPDNAAAARVRARLVRSATAGALAVQLQLDRGGRTYLLALLTNADLEQLAPLTLLRGDVLRLTITTVGTAGVTVAGILSIEERT